MGAAASITVICLNCSLCASSALQVSAGGGNAFDDFRFCISTTLRAEAAVSVVQNCSVVEKR